jgi:outer membrane protein OmpA-like peptidoglycan-associated protein
MQMLATLLLTLVVQGTLPPPPTAYDPFVLFFRAGKATIDPEGRRLLDRATRYVHRNGTAGIEILGHADSAEGSATATLNLSRRRAERVRRYLRAAGIPARSITLHATGAATPLARSPDPVNRFVSIVF